MKEKGLLCLLIVVLALGGCATPSTTPPVVITENPFIPAPITPLSSPYPPPTVGNPKPTEPSYPAPSTPSTGSTALPPSIYAPQPGDNNLTRSQVFIDPSTSNIEVLLSEPLQVTLILNGNLPDPCHLVRVLSSPPDASNNINLDVYSVIDPNKICTTVLQPFSVKIPLGTYTGGEYSVVVNGARLGQFTATYAPQPEDNKLTRGDVNLDLSLSRLVVLEDQNKEWAASLQGYLPDPCHQLRVNSTPADAQHNINLEVYSVYDTSMMCIMVIVPFEVTVPLGKDLSGHYSVFVNGQLLGEFDK